MLEIIFLITKMDKEKIKELMADWAKKLDEVLGLNDLPLKMLAKWVYELSDILVGKQKMIKYFEDEKFIKAYASFFFSQNFARSYFVFNELINLTDIKKCTELKILDLGSGIGASILPVCEILKENKINFKIDCIESSVKAAETLKLLLNKTQYKKKINIINEDFNRFKTGKYNIIIATTSLNESEQTIKKLISTINSLLLSPSALIIIEPAWKQGFELIKNVKTIIQKPPLLPCNCADVCMVDKEQDWCHFSMKLRLPDITLRVNQLLKHNLDYIKFTYGVFCNDILLKNNNFRVIIPPTKRKGKTILRICNGGNSFWLERLDRDKTDINKDFDNCSCGDIVEFDYNKKNELINRVEKNQFFKIIS